MKNSIIHFSGESKIIAKTTNRNAIGRGGKLVVSRPVSSASIRSVSSTDSNMDVNTSNPWRKRYCRLQSQSVSDGINVEPCELPHGKLVVITSVIDQNTVFVRSFAEKDNDRYLKYLNDVVESSKAAPTLDNMPKIGDIVLAEFEGAYYRALVALIVRDEAVVAFLEFGNLEKKLISTLKKLRDDLKYEPRFTFKAKLSNEGLKTDKCVNYLQQLMQKCVPLKFTQKMEVASPSEDVHFELIVNATSESVNEKVKKLNNIKVDKRERVYEKVISPF